MALDKRCKNVVWNLHRNANGTVPHCDAELAVLMDIRDELQTIRQLAQCFRIPRALDAMIELGKAERRRERNRKKRAKGRKNG